jgi:glycosyltransferase involved in cell wall biosynthesis
MTQPKHAIVVGPMAPPLGGMQTFIELLLQMNSPSWRVTGFDTTIRTKKGLGILRPLVALGQAMRFFICCLRDMPDVVHIQITADRSFWHHALFVSIAHLLRRRIIVHIHGGRFITFLKRQKGLGAWLAKKILRAPTRIVVLWAGMQQELIEYLPGIRTQVIPNGINLPKKFHARTRAASSKGLRVLYIGRIEEKKGIHDLLTAMLSLKKEVSELTLVGDLAPDQESIEKLINELTQEQKLIIAGAQPNDKIGNYYNAADVFILPSHTEAMPLTILEAMVHGTPIIATRVGAIPEMLEKTGATLIPPHDPSAIRKAIQSAYRSPKRLLAQSRKLQERVRRYDISILYDRVIKLYGECT